MRAGLPVYPMDIAKSAASLSQFYFKQEVDGRKMGTRADSESEFASSVVTLLGQYFFTAAFCLPVCFCMFSQCWVCLPCFYEDEGCVCFIKIRAIFNMPYPPLLATILGIGSVVEILLQDL
jgi:hypothetical protein